MGLLWEWGLGSNANDITAVKCETQPSCWSVVIH